MNTTNNQMTFTDEEIILLDGALQERIRYLKELIEITSGGDDYGKGRLEEIRKCNELRKRLCDRPW